MAASTILVASTSLPRSVGDAHAQLLKDDSIQFALPAYVRPEPPSWIKPLAEVLSAVGPYLIYIFWGAVLSGAGIIAFLIILEAKGIAWRLPWRRTRPADQEEERWRPDSATAQILLSEADELAARGEFSAAVHLLLQRSVADIAGRMPGFLRPSLTARDIAHAADIPRPVRAAFTEIAQIVESGLFARQPVGIGAWRMARDAYTRFAFPDAWA